MAHAKLNHGEGRGRHPTTCRQIVEVLQEHRERLKKLGVERIDLFGSAARGELGSHSDVDMVVEFSQTTYRRFVQVKSFLESVLGRKVDLLTPPAVQGRLKQEIERDLIHVPT
ncbi:MAG: nucleotidyltransferase family protein [Phycisphaerales bacterium]